MSDTTRIAMLEKQVAAYRLLAVNEGWSHRLAEAYGHKAYTAFRIDEVDVKANRTIASGYDAAGWLRDHGSTPTPVEPEEETRA